MNKEKILIGPSTFAELDKSPQELLIANGYEIIDNPYKRKLTEIELINLLEDDVVGLLAGLENLNYNVMSQSSLKAISRIGSGLSNIDLDSAKTLGIEVTNTPNGPTIAVAEFTVGILLSMIRMMPEMNQDLHLKEWNKRIGLQLEGKTIAIIGFGRIGRHVASLLSSFKVKIIVVDPYLKEQNINYQIFSLEKALPISDIIIIHSSGDKCMLSDDEFAMMKEGVFILNPARGGLLSEKALIKALDSKNITGAWLDSFEIEPYSGPLVNYNNVILTPHVGSYTLEGRVKMETDAVNNLLKSINNKRG